MLQKKIFVYGAAGLGLLGAIGAFMSGGGILTIIAGALAGLGSLFAILFYRYGYILVPLITQQTKTVVLTDTGYEIPPSEDVIVKGANGVYYASAFLSIKIFESASERSTEENIAYNEFFERAISNLKYVTKISYLLYVEDVREKRRFIETKRAEAQLRLSREKEKPEPDVLRIDKYEREVALWEGQLNKLIRGVKPMGVIAFAMTTGVGISKEAAIAAANAQANELKTVLANALNVEVEQLKADDMLKCFEWEKFIPTTAQELEEAVV